MKKVIGNEDMAHISITIPCDSTDAWVVAAYDELDDVEMLEDPWDRIIAKGKHYHGIRVRGNKKSTNTYQQFSGKVAECWNTVTEKCRSAEILEQEVRRILMDEVFYDLAARNRAVLGEEDEEEEDAE